MFTMGPFSKTKIRDVALPVASCLDKLQQYSFQSAPVPLQLSSSAFPAGGLLPSLYRYSGYNCNPPLQISGLPTATRSMSVILEQRDAPVAARTHWVCWDLPPVTDIATREIRGTHGRNDFLHHGYTGPYTQDSLCRYYIVVYALRSRLHLPCGASRHQAERLLASQLLACGELDFYA